MRGAADGDSLRRTSELDDLVDWPENSERLEAPAQLTRLLDGG